MNMKTLYSNPHTRSAPNTIRLTHVCYILAQVLTVGAAGRSLSRSRSRGQSQTRSWARLRRLHSWLLLQWVLLLLQ